MVSNLAINTVSWSRNKECTHTLKKWNHRCRFYAVACFCLCKIVHSVLHNYAKQKKNRKSLNCRGHNQGIDQVENVLCYGGDLYHNRKWCHMNTTLIQCQPFDMLCLLLCHFYKHTRKFCLYIYKVCTMYVLKYV